MRITEAGAFSAVIAVAAVAGNVLGNGLAPQRHHKIILTEVFSDPDFQLTGVTVSKAGRLFVNYPRWSDQLTKAATMNFVKSLAKQLGPNGIRVNGVAPVRSGQHYR